MPEHLPFAQVIVDIAADSADKTFTYRVPTGMRLSTGTRVLVPFGRQTKGVVISLTDTCQVEEGSRTSSSRLRTIQPSCRPWWLAKEISMASNCSWRWRCG